MRSKNGNGREELELRRVELKGVIEGSAIGMIEEGWN